MKLTTLMIIKSVASFILGIVLLAAPGLLLTLVSLSDSMGAAIFGRIYGAACIGISLLTWFARNAGDSVARRAIILDACVYDAIGFLILLVIQLSGRTNALGWLYIIVYFFFAVAFGYFLLPQKKAVLYPS